MVADYNSAYEINECARQVNPITRSFVVIAGLAGAFGVSLGALRAHAGDGLSQVQLDSLGTVSSYLLIHALLLLMVSSSTLNRLAVRRSQLAGGLCICGMVLFCGGIALSVLMGIEQLSGAAPIGGLAFIAAWLVVASCAFALREEI